ncbi:MAG: regulatory protein GemA [Subdoligranulum variabile]|nr:MAG: regulatory protein GemA [Subdoligranulum variabile]
MPSTINNYQIQKIYAIGGALGMKGTDRQDALHDLVHSMTGKASVKELTYSEACRVIGELEARQGTPPPRKGGRPLRKAVPGRASEGQIRKVRALMYQLEEASPSKARLDDRLCGIIKKTLGVEAFPSAPFAWVTYKGCSTLIETLKGYVATARKKEGDGDERVGHPG